METFPAGWIKLDVVWAVKNWLEYQELVHGFHIECSTCDTPPVALEAAHKPFIIINTKTVKKVQRTLHNHSNNKGDDSY